MEKTIAGLSLIAVLSIAGLAGADSEAVGEWGVVIDLDSIERGGVFAADLVDLTLTIERGAVEVCVKSGDCQPGRLNEGRVDFEVPIADGEKISFSGQVDGESLYGNALLPGGASLPWVGRWSATTWYCGNHQDPRHSATSRAEMEELSQEHGCERWTSG